MSLLPKLGVVYFDVADALPRESSSLHRYGQPMRPLDRLDTVAVTPTVLIELNIVIVDEHVTALHLIEKAEPRDIAGLKNYERGHGPSGGHPEGTRHPYYSHASCRVHNAVRPIP